MFSNSNQRSNLFMDLDSSLQEAFKTPENMSMSKLIELSGIDISSKENSQLSLIKGLEKNGFKITVQQIAFINMLDMLENKQEEKPANNPKNKG